MNARCSNPRHSSYKNYGGRGISVCERWHDFANFLADMGEKPAGHSIDRVDNNANYSPENCRWASVTEQARNKRNVPVLTLDGVSAPRPEWRERLHFKRGTLEYRLAAGWTVHDALTAPITPVARRRLRDRRPT